MLIFKPRKSIKHFRDMKVFLIVWMVIVWILLIVGWVWYYLDRKNEKRNKTPMILLAIGNFMLAVYFFVFILILRK